jgi:hypothetical protein
MPTISKLSVMPGPVVMMCCVAALMFGVIVLGFLGYEISWKARRLSSDRARLRVLVGQLSALGHRADSTREG